MQLSAATGRRDETVKLSQRIPESEPQHSLAVLVMTVEAARQGDLKGAEAQLAVLPGRGSDQVLLHLMHAWIKTGLGEVVAGLPGAEARPGEDIGRAAGEARGTVRVNMGEHRL